MEGEGEMSNINDLDDDSLQELYSWIDEIPLSRPKRNIGRDFSDGVLVAEIVNHFLPTMVELHNYSAANSVTQKKDNWTTLQRKVLGRLEYRISADFVDGICKSKTGAIEMFLINLRNKIDKYLAKKRAAALRKQHQVYDEFSSSAISDHLSYGPEEGYTINGTPINNGFPYTNISQQELFASLRSNAMGNVSHQNEYYQGGYIDQQPSQAFLQQNIHGPPKPHLMGKKESTIEAKHIKTDHKSLQQCGPKQQRRTLLQESPQNMRLLLEEKEQALLASQETVQILQVKVRRLEHLLNLKDIRIEDLTRKLQQATQPPPRHLPPQHNPPVPPLSGPTGQALPRMHSTPPLPPVRSPPKHNS